MTRGALLLPGFLCGCLALAALSPRPAAALEFNVAPKNEQTIFYSPDGKYTPKRLRYRLSTTRGTGTWTLEFYKRFLAADAASGGVGPKPRTVDLRPDDRKVRKLDPGIYTQRIRWVFRKGQTKIKAPRYVTLIVEGDPAAGFAYFNKSCKGCHSLDTNGIGPRLRDVYGRKAGTTPDFPYSDALKAYGKVWEERNLNDWLTNPRRLVPGAKMFVRVAKPVDRMNIIAYLKGISP